MKPSVAFAVTGIAITIALGVRVYNIEHGKAVAEQQKLKEQMERQHEGACAFVKDAVEYDVMMGDHVPLASKKITLHNRFHYMHYPFVSVQDQDILITLILRVPQYPDSLWAFANSFCHS